MANLRCLRFLLVLYACQFLVLLQTKVSSYQYKVGDLDSWGIPPSVNPQLYYYWAKYHTLKIGDSLLFLYPPSQDSLIQVTQDKYNSCNLTDPILYMNNGNSLFNITSDGSYYFTSGVPGHCEKMQKLQILVGNVSAYSPSSTPDDSAASGPSYPTVFGSIPLPPSASITSYSSTVEGFSLFLSAVVGLAIAATVNNMV